MTIEKDKAVRIPMWLIAVVAPFVVTIITSYGMLQATKTELELKSQRNEKDIETLRVEKVSKDQFQLVIEQLNRIEKKLDTKVDK